MNPKHIGSVPDSVSGKDGKETRLKATAPYNFIELPTKVVVSEVIPDNNFYERSRHTGKIICKLTTTSPLYIRCGMNPVNFAKFDGEPDETLTENQKKAFEAEKRQILAPFFENPTNHCPTIPGSSLRGMLRTLVEIISFGKIERVSEQQRFFFRAVAAKGDDPLGREYKSLLKKVKAGYLVKNGSWYIRPAKDVDNSAFLWVKERDLSNIRSLIRMDRPGYRPQYINVSFGEPFFKSPRRFTKKVSANRSLYSHKGILVTSGNMLEASDNPENLNRKNHCIVPEPDESATPIKISDDAIQHYCSALTDFQKQEPFDKKMGVLQEGLPIFYCEPQNGQSEVTLFGQSPNFRIPYSPNHNGLAASAVDFIPKHLRKSDTIDLANAIFGFVKTRNTQTEKKADVVQIEALAGRVFIENAVCQQRASEDIWLTGNLNEVVTPKILSTPKPTTFQHYLVQESFEKSQLKHYASKPPSETESGEIVPGETMIRGHKLYWHKPNVGCEEIEENDREKIERARSQYTDIKPIKAGVSFDFTIHFENLSDVELGALLWVLEIAAEPEYCLSLGMGKPLGMGAVKIEHQLCLSDRHKRYNKLFDSTQWETAENYDTAKKQKEIVEAFEAFMLDAKTGISEEDHPKGRRATCLKEVPRIEMLLAMLICDTPPTAEDTRYMTIDAKEYVDRPVLPTPFQVVNMPDTRRHEITISSSERIQTNRVKEMPKKKTDPVKKKPEQGHSEGGGGINLATQRPTKPPRRP